jgi:DNA-binding SARP family transcriptional activator
MSQLQLSLLGVPIVKHGEQTLTFSTRKALALLVYLAVEGGTHTRKALSESFWPELDAEHGRAALRATLLELRRLFERSHQEDEPMHLRVERDTLGFEAIGQPTLDLRFIEVVRKHVGHRSEGAADQEQTEVVARLERATHLVRGPFLAGFTLRDSPFFDDWTRQHREHWHMRANRLFDALSLLYERAGDGEHAITTVSRWLEFDRLNEEGYRRLMRLRFSQGDRVGALRAYTNCCAVLTDELQLEPEPETVALARRIRHTAPVRAKHSQPSYYSISQPPATLPENPFVGRTAAFGGLIECYQRVHAGQPHFVVLQGEGGVGKTRLAREFVSWSQAQGATVLTGQALQTTSRLPYQPLIDLLRPPMEQEHAPEDLLSDFWLTALSRLLPELHDRYPDLPIPSTDKVLGDNWLFEAVSRLLRRWAARGPLVLWLDDIQWADMATRDLLLYLARSLVEQPAPLLLLLNLRTRPGIQPDQQFIWLQALKRTSIPLTTEVLTAFTKEETLRFVQSLAWAEQPVAREKQQSYDPVRDSHEGMTDLALLNSFTAWLYVLTQGHPFDMIEVIAMLFKRKIIMPSRQENESWGLVLRSERLAKTRTEELIPGSVREVIRTQLGQLTPPAWALLVAGAVLGNGLTFERLCQVAQIDERAGLLALDELLRGDLLCEKELSAETLSPNEYSFPREITRKIVYLEAGATRQRLVQQRVSLLLQEEGAPHLAIKLSRVSSQDAEQMYSI